jgi:hypothetical protein
MNLENLQKLTPQEKLELVNGITAEAALILKKIFPESKAIDMLVKLKTGFSNF